MLARKWHLLAILLTVSMVTAALLFVKPTLFLGNDNGCSSKNVYEFKKNVQLLARHEKRYSVEFAKTTSQQELGLSSRPCFPHDAALVFLFPTSDKFGIWMKNMEFPIDVIWLNEKKQIVTIEKAMKPDSYPKVYYPTEDAQYAVEFAEGQANVLGLQVGDTLNW